MLNSDSDRQYMPKKNQKEFFKPIVFSGLLGKNIAKFIIKANSNSLQFKMLKVLCKCLETNQNKKQYQAIFYILTQIFQGNDLNLTSSGCERTEGLAKYWKFLNK